MKTYIFTYLVIAFIYQMFFLIHGWKDLKKKLANPNIAGMLAIFKASKPEDYANLKKKILSPYVLFLLAIIIVMVSPFSFPWLFWQHIKYIFGKKDNSDEAIMKQMHNAEKSAEEFMQTEGVPIDDDTAYGPPPPPDVTDPAIEIVNIVVPKLNEELEKLYATMVKTIAIGNEIHTLNGINTGCGIEYKRVIKWGTRLQKTDRKLEEVNCAKCMTLFISNSKEDVQPGNTE